MIATTKTYRHGTRARYTLGRCRCDDCRRANSDYAIARERRLTLASFGCADPLTVDAAEVREHLLFLRDAGVGLRQIASITGVSRTTLYQLRTGESRRVTWRCADRILGVCTGDRAPGARYGTSARLTRMEAARAEAEVARRGRRRDERDD